MTTHPFTDQHLATLTQAKQWRPFHHVIGWLADDGLHYVYGSNKAKAINKAKQGYWSIHIGGGKCTVFAPVANARTA